MQNKLILGTLLALAACGDDGGHAVQPDAPMQQTPDAPVQPADKCATTPSPLRADLPWYGNNAQTLTAWLDEGGCKSAAYDPAHKPVALFRPVGAFA